MEEVELPVEYVDIIISEWMVSFSSIIKVHKDPLT